MQFFKLNYFSLYSKFDTLYCYNRLEERDRNSQGHLDKDVGILPFWFGLFMWFFLCVFCATIISALFSAIKRRAERNNHLSTCQPEIELHDLDSFREKTLLTGKMPSIDNTIDSHTHA